MRVRWLSVCAVALSSCGGSSFDSDAASDSTSDAAPALDSQGSGSDGTADASPALDAGSDAPGETGAHDADAPDGCPVECPDQVVLGAPYYWKAPCCLPEGKVCSYWITSSGYDRRQCSAGKWTKLL